MPNLDTTETDLPVAPDVAAATGGPDGALDPAVEAILHAPESMFGHERPLRAAWGWNRSGTPDDLRRAAQILAVLLKRAPHVEEIWYEQAFNLSRHKPPKRAEMLARLETMGRVFGSQLSEDTLSLWGRWYKDEGDRLLALTPPDRSGAATAYTTSLGLYKKAYLIHKDRFPGINMATLLFLVSGLYLAMTVADPELRTNSETLTRIADLQKEAAVIARELLADRAAGRWHARLNDDGIWMAATEAEAQLILRNWDAAATAYARALQPDPKLQPFHFDSIYGQVRRLTAGFERLGETLGGPLADSAAFFRDLAAKANVKWPAVAPG